MSTKDTDLASAFRRPQLSIAGTESPLAEHVEKLEAAESALKAAKDAKEMAALALYEAMSELGVEKWRYTATDGVDASPRSNARRRSSCARRAPMTSPVKSFREVIAMAAQDFTDRIEPCHWRTWNACKVCGAMPDADGNREHSRGCYTCSANGGGSDYVEACECAVCVDRRNVERQVAEAAQVRACRGLGIHDESSPPGVGSAQPVQQTEALDALERLVCAYPELQRSLATMPQQRALRAALCVLVEAGRKVKP